ncbi:MAG: ATP-binding cassette domain-containing protein [Candidatus Heimdallarchaeota archaeon]|nr:ATP-binding cassette domain-containing protein [Candidatus Heimdallarchaeota archaeon]
MVLLDVKNLKTYFETKLGSVKAVDDVSFQLKKGEVLGLAGESGCGKTTTCLSLMRMIEFPGRILSGKINYEYTNSIIKSYDGAYDRYLFDKVKPARENKKESTIFEEAFVDNILFKRGIKDRSNNLLDLTEAEMRRIRGKHIAMIFQGAMNALNPVHRVGNQIKEAITIHDPDIENRDAWDKVLNILETVGIDSSRARDYPHQLSGGMKQRALIAMALVNNPQIVIADEPVTALDVIVQAQVLKATKELQKQFDLSMIMITHDLSVIAEVCETLAIMYAGKMVEYGKLRDVYKEPLHPYTDALINAFPSITGPKTELFDIGGRPPDLRNPPTGCRFHPRCPKVMPICSKEEPRITKIREGYVICHLYQD